MRHCEAWMKTSQQAMEELNQRGIVCDRRTVTRWAADGRFPGAIKTRPDSRGDWLIPEESLETFLPPAAATTHPREPAAPPAVLTIAHMPHTNSDAAPGFTTDEEFAEQTYRQPWASAYLRAIRDFAADPYHVAGVTPAEVTTEAAANFAFSKTRELLWRRRFTASHRDDGITFIPHPILSSEAIEHARLGKRDAEKHYRLLPRDRPRFDEAVRRGYLHADQCNLSLRNLWWRYCELMGQPYIFQTRSTRWYTSLDIDLWCVYEGDGRPRIMPPAMLDEINAIFEREERRRKDWQPDPYPSTNRRSRSDPYLPYTPADLGAELLTIYRRYFPDDPPPNPERDPSWEGFARLVPHALTPDGLFQPINNSQSRAGNNSHLAVGDAEHEDDENREPSARYLYPSDGPLPPLPTDPLPSWEDGYCYAVRRALDLEERAQIRRYGITRFALLIPPLEKDDDHFPIRVQWIGEYLAAQLPGAEFLGEKEHEGGWIQVAFDWSVKRSALQPLRTVHGITTALAAGRRIGYRVNALEPDVFPIQGARWKRNYYERTQTVLQVQPEGTDAWVTPYAIAWMDVADE